MSRPVCSRPGCAKRVPEGRRKYCSVACSDVMMAEHSMDRRREQAEKDREDLRNDLMKAGYAERSCLRCGRMFMSESKANRRCPRCEESVSVCNVSVRVVPNRILKTTEGEV